MPKCPMKGIIQVITGNGDHKMEKEKSVLVEVALVVSLLLLLLLLMVDTCCRCCCSKSPAVLLESAKVLLVMFHSLFVVL